jgi:hypothetical protein
MPRIKLPPLLAVIEIVLVCVIVVYVIHSLFKWWKNRGAKE